MPRQSNLIQRERAADTLCHYFARAISGWNSDNDREIREAVDGIFDCIPAAEYRQTVAAPPLPVNVLQPERIKVYDLDAALPALAAAGESEAGK